MTDRQLGPDSENKTTLSGQPPAPGFENAKAPQPLTKDGTYGDYWVLTKQERKLKLVRPLRFGYKHAACRGDTVLGRPLAETYARDPSFYTSTFCIVCREHFPVSEFTWPDGSPVGS